jgi:hypothetical protein
MQWNVSSVKRGTFQAIRENRQHLIFFQEILSTMRTTPAYYYVSRCRDMPSHDGGVAIRIEKILTLRNLVNIVPTHLYE